MSKTEKQPKKKKGQPSRSAPQKIKNPKSNIIGDNLKTEYVNFIREYVHNGGNGTRAYRYAYPNSKDTTAAVESHRLLRIPKIIDAIRDEYSRIFKEKDKEFSKGKVYKQISDIADSNIADIIEIDGDTMIIKDLRSLPASIQKSIKSVKATRRDSETGSQVVFEVVLHDKMKALELQSKIMRLINDDAPDIDVIIIPARVPTEPRKRQDIEPEYTVEKDGEDDNTKIAQ